MMATRERLLTIKIDARLAGAYRRAYARAFGDEHSNDKTPEEFIAAFVEDRLAEEIAFCEEEA